MHVCMVEISPSVLSRAGNDCYRVAVFAGTDTCIGVESDRGVEDREVNGLHPPRRVRTESGTVSIVYSYWYALRDY